MNKAFKKWHKNAVLITSIPVGLLNKICSEFYDGEFYIYTREEDQRNSYEIFKTQNTDCADFKDYCDHWYSYKISIKMPKEKPSTPSTVILSEILGVEVHDIYWDDMFGYNVIIKYRIKG